MYLQMLKIKKSVHINFILGWLCFFIWHFFKYVKVNFYFFLIYICHFHFSLQISKRVYVDCLFLPGVLSTLTLCSWIYNISSAIQRGKGMQTWLDCSISFNTRKRLFDLLFQRAKSQHSEEAWQQAGDVHPERGRSSHSQTQKQREKTESGVRLLMLTLLQLHTFANDATLPKPPQQCHWLGTKCTSTSVCSGHFSFKLPRSTPWSP